MLADTQIVIHPHAYKHGLGEEQIRSAFSAGAAEARVRRRDAGADPPRWAIIGFDNQVRPVELVAVELTDREVLIIHANYLTSGFATENEESAMSDHIAADGTVLTDAVIAELAQEAEQGFPNSELTTEASPWARPAPMETHSVRVPGELWSLVAEAARKQNMSTSEYTRLALLRSLRSA